MYWRMDEWCAIGDFKNMSNDEFMYGKVMSLAWNLIEYKVNTICVGIVREVVCSSCFTSLV